MFYKAIIVFFLMTGIANAQFWKFTVAWTHSYPDDVAYFNLYCKNMDQTWDQGFKWKVPNTMSQNPEIEFTTPKVIPWEIYYCCAATAVDKWDYESSLPVIPGVHSDHDCWDCLWIKTEDMGFDE